MKLGKNGLELIKSFEGLHLNAYLDPVGIPTIGYGHISTAKMGQKITEKQAEKLLLQDVANAEAAVNSYVTVPLTQNQYDALVSFTFNLGAGNLKRSDLLKYTNLEKFDRAAQEFGRWVYAKGTKLNGLVRRREAEKTLYLSPAATLPELEGVPDWGQEVVREAKKKGIETDLRKTAGEIPLYQLLLLIKKFFG